MPVPVAVAVPLAGVGVGVGVSQGRTCEPIRVELCRSRGYNMTTMPNLAGHEFQKEADGHLSTFAPLVQYGCSSQLLLFLCAVLVPMCTDKVPEPIGPCRGLCVSVRERCLPVLQGFGYPWPPQMDCAKFPPHNSPAHMCMEGDGEDFPVRGGGGGAPLAGPLGGPLGGHLGMPAATRCHGYPAGDPQHFSRADKQMAEVWLSIWSGLCFVSSVLALLTLRLGPAQAQVRIQERVQQGGSAPGTVPRRPQPQPLVSPPPPPGWRLRGAGTSPSPSPLASLALSYGLLSVGWGIRVLAGRAVPVSVPAAGATAATAATAAASVACETSDLRNPSCAAVFLLTYYFGTASLLW